MSYGEAEVPNSSRSPSPYGETRCHIRDPDGYIISSAFNFSNNPALIVVAIPGST